MPLFVPVVLFDVVQIISTNRQCAAHLVAMHLASQYFAPDGHIASEGALLVHIISLDSFTRRFVAKPNVLVPPHILRKQS